MKEKSTLYPLGGEVFAGVNRHHDSIRIYIRHYKLLTKGGRHVTPTRKQATLNVKQFKRLLKISPKILEEVKDEKEEKTPKTDEAQQCRIEQRRIDLPPPFYSPSYDP